MLVRSPGRKIGIEPFSDEVRLSGSQLSTIGGFEGLESLSVSGLDDVWRRRDLVNLRFLKLRDVRLSDRGMSVIGRFAKLESLVIIEAEDDPPEQRVTSGGWANLQQLPALTHLGLADSGLTDASLDAVGPCTGLIALQVSSGNIRGAGSMV